MITIKCLFEEQKINRMVVNVANSIISSGRHSPGSAGKSLGVTVNRQNELLQLRDKEGVIVQVDGQPSITSDI